MMATDTPIQASGDALFFATCTSPNFASARKNNPSNATRRRTLGSRGVLSQSIHRRAVPHMRRAEVRTIAMIDVIACMTKEVYSF